MEREQVIERLKEEHDALKEKYGRLLNALNDEGFIQEVGEDQVELLLDQESIMRLYLKTLTLRIGNLAEAKTEPKKEKEGAKERKKESPSKVPKKDAEEIAVIKSFINALKEVLEDSPEKKEGNENEIVSYYVKI